MWEFRSATCKSPGISITTCWASRKCLTVVCPGSQEVTVAFFEINDKQFIEIFPGLRPDQPVPFRYVGMYTDDIAKLHKQLQNAELPRGRSANRPKAIWSFRFSPGRAGLEFC